MSRGRPFVPYVVKRMYASGRAHHMKITCQCPLVAALLLACIVLWGCDENAPVDVAPDPGFLLSGALASHCYSWPEQAFSPQNVAVLEAALPVGSSAADFSLRDIEGNAYRLSELLQSKPVLLILGAYT